MRFYVFCIANKNYYLRSEIIIINGSPNESLNMDNNNNNNMYLKSSIQTSSIDYIKENIHITLNISSNIPIQ